MYVAKARTVGGSGHAAQAAVSGGSSSSSASATPPGGTIKSTVRIPPSVEVTTNTVRGIFTVRQALGEIFDNPIGAPLLRTRARTQLRDTHLGPHSFSARIRTPAPLRCPARFAQRPAPLSTQPSVLCTSVCAQSTSFVAVKRIALRIMSRGSSSRSIQRHFVKRSFSKMDLQRSTTSPTASECSTTERASTPPRYLIGPKMASRTPQRRCAADDKSVWGGHGLMKPSPQLSLLGGWPAHLMAGLISSPADRARVCLALAARRRRAPPLLLLRRAWGVWRGRKGRERAPRRRDGACA